MNGINDFIYNIWFIYKNVIWWGWEKNPEIYKRRNKGKNSLFSCPPIHPPPIYEVEAYCFPVSKNTENKLALP